MMKKYRGTQKLPHQDGLYIRRNFYYMVVFQVDGCVFGWCSLRLRGKNWIQMTNVGSEHPLQPRKVVANAKRLSEGTTIFVAHPAVTISCGYKIQFSTCASLD